jgi:hypothetical protein
MVGKLFIKRLYPDSHSEERKFSCHICSKSFKKVMPFFPTAHFFLTQKQLLQFS